MDEKVKIKRFVDKISGSSLNPPFMLLCVREDI